MTLSGGPVFWLLVVLAIAAVVIFFERFFELRRAQIDWQDFIKGVVNILAGGNADEALAICEDTAVPIANVVATAIRHRDAGE
ncbi:MAG: MotA/TolQ/ExbB proton channel family protein, partial [Kiritimatiellae bacterium]|nr:MotA/TolQ/ExbB proton channel family protein [Kiritimatiellia bacterium]